MARLAGSVPVHKDGETTWYLPGDDLPEEVAAQIGEHAFVADPDDEDGKDAVHPFPEARAAFVAKRDGKPIKDEDGDGTPDREPGVEPARNGKGSSRDAWVSFAAEKQFVIPEGVTSRDEIIAAMVDAGVIENS